MIKCYSSLLLLLLSSCTTALLAQKRIYSEQFIKQEKEKTISFSDRWSIRTNAWDWITTVPNIQVEFDLSDSVYNRWSLGAGVKYNYIPTHTDFSSRLTYKIADVRLEARKYFRSYQILPYRGKSKRKSSPKGWWRAYYVGPYVSFTKYAFHIGDPKYDGKAVSAGLTTGFNIPLYQCRNRGAIDMDFGLSVGALYTQYKDMANNSQQVKKFLPYPMITDLRIAFVYRFRSVRKKYIERNQDKILQKQTERLMREKMESDRKMAEKLRQDSLMSKKPEPSKLN